jgi:hypothetical protein
MDKASAVFSVRRYENTKRKVGCMRGSWVTVPVAQKYPQFSSVPDDELVIAIVGKNPEYNANYRGASFVSVGFDSTTGSTLPDGSNVTDWEEPPSFGLLFEGIGTITSSSARSSRRCDALGLYLGLRSHDRSSFSWTRKRNPQKQQILCRYDKIVTISVSNIAHN